MLHIPKKALLLASKRVLRPQDVFQSRIRTGTGAAAPQSVGFRPDLVWNKSRGAAGSHYLFDTDRGALQEINSDTTDATASLAQSLTSFDASGYTLGTASVVNGSGATFVDWLFKEAPGFFKKGVINHTSGTADTRDLSSLGVVGMVVAKITNTTGNWPVWHRSLTAGNNLLLNTTDAQSTTGAIVSVSGTTITLAAAAPTGTYEIYAFAHQPSGIIQCGLFSAINGTVNIGLGWDTQWVFTKSSTAVNAWGIRDTARGLDNTGGPTLQPNLNTAEAASTNVKTISNGFSFVNTTTSDYIYCAIKKAA